MTNASPSTGRRGSLRIYLGAAPGVGKTFAALNEARRAKQRGSDVVVGYVETHARPRTTEQLGDLEVIPRKQLAYRDSVFEEMDIDAVLARRPERVVVDELAHTNVPGSRNRKRWEDVQELLAAGIDVISTVNIQHLESLNDVVERITGIRQQETIPDEAVRAADQVELVDQTPEALRRRMAHGNIYGAEKIDAALANYFREGNLGALRELALLWLADKVDVGLESYRERHGITEPWETRERVVVALTGSPSAEALIRRAARIAQRSRGELIGVHVRSDEGLVGPQSEQVELHRTLLVDLGGEYREISGADVATALVGFARAENATQLVLGASDRSRWTEAIRGSVINKVIRSSGPVDVHVISHSRDEAAFRTSAGGRRRTLRRSPFSARRRVIAWSLALGGVALLTLFLAQLRDQTGLPTVLLAFLALAVAAAGCGGTLPALTAALLGFLAANWYFTPPFHHLSIAEGENVVALVVFLGVALATSRFVDTAARRSADAARARSEARTLASLAASMSEADPLPTLLSHLRSVFALDAAALLRRAGDGWHVEAASGDAAPARPQDADHVEDLGDLVLALNGPPLDAADRAVLNAFASQLAAASEHDRLRAEAGRARELAATDALRSALLQAVSHDLRTPLSSIKATVTTLRQHDLTWTPAETEEFLATIDAETDRLTRLVGNLLDMSRIQVGALHPIVSPVGLEEVVPAAIAGLGTRAALVDADISESLPQVAADAALLERILANVIENAVRFTPEGQRVRVEAGLAAGRLDVRVVDRGPGIPRADRHTVFEPFQRLGDDQPGIGVGLGLAVARGFAEAMGAHIEIDDTPGGGTTVVISLPVET